MSLGCLVDVLIPLGPLRDVDANGLLGPVARSHYVNVAVRQGVVMVCDSDGVNLAKACHAAIPVGRMVHLIAGSASASANLSDFQEVQVTRTHVTA